MFANSHIKLTCRSTLSPAPVPWRRTIYQIEEKIGTEQKQWKKGYSDRDSLDCK